MLNDYAGSRSHRNGLLKALSREKDFDKKLLPSDYERLEKQSSEILSEVRARFPDLAVKADYFAMETCLCSFKKVWRANSSRYLGYYAERQAEEISQASQDGWTGIEWNVMEDGRVEKLDPRLLERVSKIRAQSFVNSFLSTHELERLDWIV